MPLSPNTSLGRYEVLSQLGAGGMGEVYLAHDNQLNRHVALKVLPAELISNGERLLRFEQEARAASALNHPNIITIHEIGVEGDTHFIATEFIEGETLRRKLQTRRLEIEETLNIATQIATAQDTAHRSGIVHRDLKPENVMVREDGLVKVLDFGLAKLTENKDNTPVDSQAPTRPQVHTNPGVVAGTVAYMSPEQARGKDVDARTDIFSLGVVLYEMLAGRLPFAGETVSDVIAAILKTDPVSIRTFNQEIPVELERIISKTLVKDREERYQTAKDLLVDLRTLKRQIEVQAEIDRTTAPIKTENGIATQILAARPTSSIDYISREIRKHKLGFAIGTLSVMLLAAIGLGYYFNCCSRFGSSIPVPIQSVAVLPFVNENGDDNVDYLSDGMTESLINNLSQLPHLSVKARSSVFRYKGKNTTPQQLASELSVQAILSGRVVQRGDDLTLYLSLVDGRNGNQLWGKQYSRKLTDIVSLQSEIARDVSQQLRGQLTGADEQKLAKNYTQNTEAYKLYLKGRFYWNKRTPKDLQKSIEHFQQAIALDTNYALAYAGLADAYALLANAGTPSREMMPRAREAAQKALSLDNNLAEAHTALGQILIYYDYDFAGAEREYKLAIELNPNYATTHQWYSEQLMAQGRHEEAFVEIRRALEIDPLSLIVNRQYGVSLLFARKYDEAIAQLKKTLELDANFPPAHSSISLAYRMKGNYAASIEEFAKYEELIGEHQAASLIRESFAKGGREGFLRAMTGDRRITNLTPYIIATFHSALGEKDKAFAELEKAYQSHDTFLGLLKVDPRFDPVRDDSRFHDLLLRIGLKP